MPALAVPERFAPVTGVGRRVLLIWQEPESRLLVKVGELTAGVRGHFTFRYLPAAREHAGFVPLAQFQDLSVTYESQGLPEFFANRVMSRRRENYDEYLSWLGLTEPAEPVELLVRTGGTRATDTFHIVDDLQIDTGGSVSSRFFASGIRHLPTASSSLAGMAAGSKLTIRDDSSNPQNSRAMLLDATDGRPVGYVPNWLVADVHGLREASTSLDIVAERVNLDAPNHLKLLCRLNARV